MILRRIDFAGAAKEERSERRMAVSVRTKVDMCFYSKTPNPVLQVRNSGGCTSIHPRVIVYRCSDDEIRKFEMGIKIAVVFLGASFV